MKFNSWIVVGLAAFATILASHALKAASLSVAPVSVEVLAPGATTTFTLRNDSERPLDAQIRVFRWTQVGGEERLVPTTDVVASPPLVSLQPKADYTVRIVRVTKTPVVGEESYRLLVDELPDPTRKQNAAVNIVLRYSIPIFFVAGGSSEAKLSWTIQPRGGRTYLVATNSGDRRARISRLQIRDARGKMVSFGDGLAGYALGRSAVHWLVPRSAGAFSLRGLVTVSAQSDRGPITASAAPTGAR